MNDKELADRIVALGVGRYFENKKDPELPSGWWYFYDGIYQRKSESFVRDWRVAGALMEKMDGAIPMVSGGIGDESLPRAICEACVEAMGDME